MKQHGKIYGNKPREKLDLNLENVMESVIKLCKLLKGNWCIAGIYVKTLKGIDGIKPTRLQTIFPK